MTESEVRAVLDRTLAFAKADHTKLGFFEDSEASTRFANNTVTQNVAKTNATLVITSAFDNRVGTVRLNRFDDESLCEAVGRAEAIAAIAAPDPEYMPPVGPSGPYTPVVAWDEAVATASPADRAAVVRQGIERAEAVGLVAAGSYATNSGFSATADSRGLFATHRATSARYIITAMSPESSGWAEGVSWNAAALGAEAVSQRAIAKALAARPPASIEARPYTVILEPAALAEMLAFLVWTMDAKSADEGRSAFSGKLGTRIAGPNITIASDPSNPLCPGAPYTEDGLPSPVTNWVENGVLTNLAHGRYWATKSGRAFTGRPGNLVMAGGDETLDSLVASTEEGILVTRFWYIRFVDPMKLLLTGMTRDGLFLVRDGKIVSGLKNMRFNESPIRMLANTVGIGAPVPTDVYISTLAPPAKVEDFTFSSGTEF